MATGTINIGALSLRPMGSVTGDLNNYKAMGIYLIPSDTTIAHKPDSDCYVLIVIQTASNTANRWQIAIGLNKLFTRYYASGANPDWKSWRYVNLTTLSS